MAERRVKTKKSDKVERIEKTEITKGFKKEIGRLRSEVRKLQYSNKSINPFTGLVSGNYWTATGMPWVSSEGRKAVLTEWFWQPVRGQPRRVDTNELRQFSQTFWINACVKTLTDEISSLDWDIIQKEGFEYESEVSHIEEVKNFLKYPNRNGESFNCIIRSLMKDLLEIDAGCLIKVFDIDSYDWELLEPKSGSPMLKPRGQRRMTELYARDGASFLKEADKFGSINGYWQYSYQIPAHPMWFNKDEVCYMQEQPRSMSCYGFARTQAIMDMVKSLHYSTLYNRKFFEETAIPDGALALKDTSETEMNAFRDNWERTFKAQPHKFVVVNKEIQWLPFSLNNRELEFLETQSAYFKWVITMFGLTPSELGITEDVNRATAATQTEVTKRKGVRPFLKLIEGYFNSEVIPEFGYENIEFQFIYDDPSEKNQRLNNWKLEIDMGVKTPNEVRKELGLSPLEGGDEIRSNFTQQQFIGNNGSRADERGVSAYRDDSHNNAERAKDEKEERDGKKERDRHEGRSKTRNTNERTRDLYSHDKRPVGNFKNLKKNLDPTFLHWIAETNSLPLDKIRAGIEVEMEHIDSVSGNMDTIVKIALDHLKEDINYYDKLREVEKELFEKPFAGFENFDSCLVHMRNQGYSDESAHRICGKLQNEHEKSKINKGVDDGQYYHDQQIAHNKFNYDPIMFGIYPSPLSADYRRPMMGITEEQRNQSQDQFADIDNIKCPTCRMNTLMEFTSADDIGNEVKLRCINCNQLYSKQEVIDNNVLESLMQIMMAPNRTKPTNMPLSPLTPR